MLTRIEIDGLKSFEQFALDLAPLTLIAGSNASGKSNLFDAIALLATLATGPLQASASLPEDLCRQTSNGSAHRLTLAIEVLLDPVTTDPWGGEARLTHTRVRYELELTRLPHTAEFAITRESARPIASAEDRWLRERGVSSAFQDAYLRDAGGTPWLTTEGSADRPVFVVADSRRHQGPLRATALSSISGVGSPHLWALRQELMSWRRLHLQPDKLRLPCPVMLRGPMQPDGANLAGVLAQLRATDGLLCDVQSDLAALLPDAGDVQVEEDAADALYRLRMRVAGGPLVGARLCSDGSLRLLALLAALHEPRSGLLCIEEPEVGLDPACLVGLLDLMRRWVSHPQQPEVMEQSPLRQLLLTTHSPVLANEASDEELRLADTVRRISPGQPQGRSRTRIREIRAQRNGVRLAELEPPAMTRTEARHLLRLGMRGT